MEELPTVSALTKEEEECEHHFTVTHSRDDHGRYVVRLPFASPPSLPGSRSVALNHLFSMERKFVRDSELRTQYSDFMQDYDARGHMIKVEPGGALPPAPNFLPHHAVYKRDGSKKLRVVFDASRRSENHKSLNDYLHAGPKLQSEITTVLTRWRRHKFVFTCDIVKMFRQILIHPEDAVWQHILWRSSFESSIEKFQLSTVTYGTACYLAIRVLHQLASDEVDAFLLAARILLTNFYVDDALAFSS